jgi:hypothetical protein
MYLYGRDGKVTVAEERGELPIVKWPSPLLTDISFINCQRCLVPSSTLVVNMPNQGGKECMQTSSIILPSLFLVFFTDPHIYHNFTGGVAEWCNVQWIEYTFPRLTCFTLPIDRIVPLKARCLDEHSLGFSPYVGYYGISKIRIHGRLRNVY